MFLVLSFHSVAQHEITELRQLVDLVDKAQNIIVLSGAGVGGFSFISLSIAGPKEAELCAARVCSHLPLMPLVQMSVASGIPDFRSARSGLFAQIRDRFGMRDPANMFDIDYFRRDARPFFLLARELWPGNFQPSMTHHFLRWLESKNKLLRCYTQVGRPYFFVDFVEMG